MNTINYMNPIGFEMNAIAIDRQNRYAGSIEWVEHCKYKGRIIERAHHIGGGPCALYRAVVWEGETLQIVSDGLAQIKDTVTRWNATGRGE